MQDREHRDAGLRSVAGGTAVRRAHAAIERVRALLSVFRKRPPGELDGVSAALAIARVTVLEAVRGRLAWLVAGFVSAGCVLALFAGELAITGTQGVRSGLLGAWLRWWAVFAAAAFAVSSALGDVRDKGFDLMLSMAAPRAAYWAGKLAGCAAVAVCSAASCALALAWFAPVPQAALWAASLGLELFIVTSMSLLCAFTFTHVALAMSAVLGFYLLSRSMAALQLIAHAPVAEPGSPAWPFFRAFVDTLAYLLPDLDRFTASEWLIHGDGTLADLGFAAVQTLVYTALLGAAALFDLYRKAP